MNAKTMKLKYVLTAILICLIGGNVWGEDVIYQENFGDNGSTKTNVNEYTKWSSNFITPEGSGWKVTTADASSGYDNASGASNAYTGSTSDLFFRFGEKLNDYANVKLSFGYRKGSANGKANSLKLYFSKDGGESWSEDLLPANTGAGKWYFVNLDVDQSYLSNFIIKFSSSSNTNRIDDITLTGKKEQPVDQVATPTFLTTTETFSESLKVELACATADAEIRYTTDDTAPSATSTLYDAVTGIVIDKTTTIKAIAVKTDMTNSEIISATYTKVLPTPDFYFNPESITINLGEAFTTPKLTNNSDGALTYISSNTNLATVTNNGTVTLVDGASGKTTITASVAETATYATATASYTLTVVDPNAPTNLVLNGSFEEKDSNWDLTAGEILNNATIARSGTYYWSYKVPTSSGNTDKIEQTINGLIIGEKYTFSFWYNNYQKSGNGIKDYSKDGSTNIAGSSPIALESSNGWTQYTNTFTAQNATFKISIRAYVNCIIDDIELIPYQESSSSTIDEATNSMLLTGAWTAEQLAALDLSKINSLDMTGISIPEGVTLNTDSNPNCLVYVSYDDMEKAEAFPNAIIADESGNIALGAIQLADGHDFHNKLAFSGDISYTRTFPTGWNTFALPFPATIADDDEIEEFDKIDENKVVFKKATTIAANTPYLINITAGKESKTFSATSIDVPVTASTGETYKSSFTKLTDNEIEGKYILVLENDKEVFAPATTNAALPAFRGYLELPQADGIRYSISHDKGGATSIDTNDSKGLSIYAENGTLNIHSDETQTIHIRCIDGRTIRTIHLAEDTDAQINGLDKGIYLINNQKVIIK